MRFVNLPREQYISDFVQQDTAEHRCHVALASDSGCTLHKTSANLDWQTSKRQTSKRQTSERQTSK